MANKKEVVKKEKVNIEPTIKIEGHENPFITAFNGDNDLELTSIGIAKLPGTGHYVSYTMVTKGSTIVSMIVEEPNLRLIAEEAAKINFVNHFCGTGE